MFTPISVSECCQTDENESHLYDDVRMGTVKRYSIRLLLPLRVRVRVRVGLRLLITATATVRAMFTVVVSVTVMVTVTMRHCGKSRIPCQYGIR